MLLYLFIDGQTRIDSLLFLQKYSKEDLLYFADVGFGYPDKVKRWDQTIRVSIAGSCSRQDSAEVAKVVDELSKIIAFPKIVLTREEGNVQVHFPDSEREFEASKAAKDLGVDVDGFASPTFSVTNKIKQVEIHLSPLLKDRLRNAILRHEFCHALGLGGHSRRYYHEEHLLGRLNIPSLESAELLDSSPAVIPAADTRALQLLYEKDMPTGLKRSSFEVQLAELGIKL
ncbi:DUF2927 domain-containing protein [Telluribacter sp. SYSU D00476]|uniref:DUF2927 domain-containing protein n=1 Tax=Telluribacter sp. SYSU D00476 TaxID=2811430 RepID=UPI001FF51ACD|nr:DUF2927 domain-containing protein [Telluribacter sp. SYSU D00476]